MRTVKTRISLCNLIRVFFLYLFDFYIGHFEQWTDMSLPCLNLCHRIHFQSNIIIIPTIQFVKIKRIQFVETQAFYKNFTTTSILLHFNMSFEFDYFLHIQPSCIHFGLRCRKQMQKDQSHSVSTITHLYLVLKNNTGRGWGVSWQIV